MSRKGDLVRGKAEVELLDGNFGLLNKYNDHVERECEDMKAMIKTFRVKV